MKTYQDLLDTVEKIEPNKQFILSDLFPKIEWTEIPVNTRRAWGTKFLYDVLEGNLDNIEAVCKNSANAQLYIKTTRS